MTKVDILFGDITGTEGYDCIVNAANKTLLGGGGVDGAIHNAAGPELKKECEKLGGCETGEAKITKGYNLNVPYIIHTVGPIYENGWFYEDLSLFKCYFNSLCLAEERGIRKIVFPAISTGAYRFPVKEAAKIALLTIKGYITENPNAFDRISICVDKREVYKEFEDALCKELIKEEAYG